MKHEIIYTDNYALIVSDEKVLEGDCYLSPYGIFYFHNHLSPEEHRNAKKIIAQRPLSNAFNLKGVPLLPEFSQEDDVEEVSNTLFRNKIGNLEEIHSDYILGFQEGHRKAKETYKYTEEDLINFSNFVTTNLMEHSDSNGFYIGVRKVLELFKQMQKPKRPKYFTIKTTNMNLDEIREQGKGFLHANTDKPVIITNSQGQKELVGTYEGDDK